MILWIKTQPQNPTIMEFDSEYFNKLSAHINKKDNVVYNIMDMTNDYEKLVYHLKYYIDYIPRNDGYLEIELNSLKFGETRHTSFRVLEFFEKIIKSHGTKNKI